MITPDPVPTLGCERVPSGDCPLNISPKNSLKGSGNSLAP